MSLGIQTLKTRANQRFSDQRLPYTAAATGHTSLQFKSINLFTAIAQPSHHTSPAESKHDKLFPSPPPSSTRAAERVPSVMTSPDCRPYLPKPYQATSTRARNCPHRQEPHIQLSACSDPSRIPLCENNNTHTNRTRAAALRAPRYHQASTPCCARRAAAERQANAHERC